MTGKSTHHGPYSTVIQCSSFLGWSSDFFSTKLRVRDEYVFFIYLFPRTLQNFKNLINWTPQNFENLIKRFINTNGVTIKKIKVHTKIKNKLIAPKKARGENSLSSVYSKKRDINPISL